jgi:hypothetical protein
MALRRTLIQCAPVISNNNRIRISKAREISSVQVPSDWSPRTSTWLLERRRALSTDASRHDHENIDNGERSTLKTPKNRVSKAPPIQRSRDERWQAKFEKLSELLLLNKDVHGSNEAFAEYEFWRSDKKVAYWLDQQRHLYRQKQEGKVNSLTDEREQKLLDLGINIMGEAFERQWMQRYEKLRNFVQERGCFPHECESKESLSKEDAKLFYWCNRQRQQYQIYKKGLRGQFTFMTEERQEKLADIDFCFDLFEESWMERYGELQEYCKHHGDCLVPHAYKANPQLGFWVRDQRYNYKMFREGTPRAITMTTERIDMLNNLDFVWSVHEMIWNKKYLLLEEHVRMNGLGSLPPWKGNGNVRSWAADQQKLFQNRLQGEENTLTKERIQKLDRLGFPWKR